MAAWTGSPALPDADLVAGGTILAADIVIMNNALHALSDAWVDFSASVAWSAASVNPAIGNGTITAAYLQANKTVAYCGRITMGSTTTFGTGIYSVALPVAVASAAGPFVGSVAVYGGSTTARSAGALVLATTTTCNFRPGTTGLGEFSSTVPYTFASGMNIIWTAIYQAA